MHTAAWMSFMLGEGSQLWGLWDSIHMSVWSGQSHETHPKVPGRRRGTPKHIHTSLLSPSVESCGCGLGPSPVRLGAQAR